MMKILNKFSDSILKQRQFGSSIFRISGYSAQTQPPTLYLRLQICCEERVSVIPVLDEWVAEGGEIHHQQLKRFITSFEKTRRFRPALEIAEWMSDKKHFPITPGHVAAQLDLISKVHGVKQAENYFNSLEASLIGLPVYGALLNCYANARSLKKAEAAMEEIRKMNSCRTRDYNTMLYLYSQMGMHEKLDSLVQEMEDKGIGYDEFTYKIMVKAYAGSDSEGLEKLLMKMGVDPLVTVNFHSCVAAAKQYLKAGALENASLVLKKAEDLIKGQEIKSAYRTLISLYAKMQKKEDVYRLWSLLENYGKLHKRFYVEMIASLVKLDDLDGAKKIMEEWEEKNASSDMQISNLIIRAYCKKGHVGEAEFILYRLIETGNEPSAKTWRHLALGYYKNGQMEQAAEMTQKAMQMKHKTS